MNTLTWVLEINGKEYGDAFIIQEGIRPEWLDTSIDAIAEQIKESYKAIIKQDSLQP